MSRFLRYFNLAGVIVLVVLCGVQWSANRRLNLDMIGLEKIQQDHGGCKLVQQDQIIKGSAADLDEFRQHLREAQAALKDAESKQTAGNFEHAQLVTERDQLKASVGKWTTAVAARDAALKQAGEQIQTLATERNNAVAQFNELAAKYNAAGQEIKKAGDEIGQLAKERNDAVTKFNELATRYNALVKEATAASTKP